MSWAERFVHKDLGQVMGSWPFQATGKVGPWGVPGTNAFHMIPTTLRNKATILGARQEPSAGFDVGGESFWLWVDTVGSPYTPSAREITFPSGGPYTLDEVITEINSDDGEADPVAFNDNGFLRLQSPRSGENSYLMVQTHFDHGAGTADSKSLVELGLFTETVSRGGEVAQSLHVDPDRQVANPGQLSMNQAESLNANVFNRLAFQMALSTDRNRNLLKKRRLAIKKEVAGTWTAGLTPPGITISGEVYTGPDTFGSPPTQAEMDTIAAVVDSSGNDIINEERSTQPGDIPSTSVTIDADDASQRPRVTILDGAFSFSSGDPNEEYYVVFSGLTGATNSTFNDVPLKIIGYEDSENAIFQDVHPDTGVRMDLSTAAPTGCEKVEITAERVRVRYIKTDSGGATNAPQLQYEKVSTVGVTRVELNKRIVVSGADFITAEVAEGDLVDWTGHAETDPYSNNGTYRVSRVVDKETLELVDESYGPVYLNPIAGTDLGDVVVKTDGTFWKDPFFQVDSNTEPADGSSVKIIYLGMSTFEDASEADVAFLAGPSVRYMREAGSEIQRALLNIVGPGAESFDDILYPSDELTNMSLERLNYRLNREHHDADGRHSVIYPDEVWSGPTTDPSDYVSGEPFKQPFVHITQGGDIVAEKVDEDYGPSIKLKHYSDTVTPSVGNLLWFDLSYEGWQSEHMTPDGGPLGTIRASGRNSSHTYAEAAKIRFVQDGAASPTHIPGRMEYHLSTGSNGPMESARMSLVDPGTGELSVFGWAGGTSQEPGMRFRSSSDPYYDPIAFYQTASGQYLGRMVWEGATTSDTAATAAYIRSYQNGSAGASQIPGAIAFGVATASDAAEDIITLERTALYPNTSTVSLGASGSNFKWLFLSAVAGDGVRTDLVPYDNDALLLGNASYRWTEGYINQTYVVGLHASETISVSNSAGHGVESDLVPAADETYDLGSSSYKWDHVHATTLNLSSAADEGVGTHLVPTDTEYSTLGNASYKWKSLYLSSAAGHGVGTHLVPVSNETYDLGNASYKWHELYLSSAAGHGVGTHLVPTVDRSHSLGSDAYLWNGIRGIQLQSGSAADGKYLTMYGASSHSWGVIGLRSPESDKRKLYIDNTYSAGGTPSGDNETVIRVGLTTSPTDAIWIQDDGRVGIRMSPIYSGYNLQVLNKLFVRSDGTDMARLFVASSYNNDDAEVLIQTTGSADARLVIDRGFSDYECAINYKTASGSAWVTGLRPGLAYFYLWYYGSGNWAYVNNTDPGDVTWSGSLYPRTHENSLCKIGASGQAWYRGYFKYLYSDTGAVGSYDDYDDLELVEQYGPGDQKVEVIKAGVKRTISLAKNELPWPCLSPEPNPNGEYYLDVGSSVAFVMGAMKQLYQKHKREVTSLRDEIAELKALIIQDD